MAAHRDWLNQFKVDTYINTEINAWAWLEAAVLRWLPVIARESDEGIYFLPLRWDYTAIDAVADLSVERFEVARLGAVSRLSQPIYNEITVNYRPARTSPKKWYVGHTITAEPGTLATVFHTTLDDRITGSHLARASQAGPWGVRPHVVDIPQTWDDSTATLVAQLLLQRYAGPKRTVRYQADKEYEAIEPGSAITITDAEIHLSRAVAYVVDVSLEGDSPVLDLILLDHAVHSKRATT